MTYFLIYEEKIFDNEII